MDRGQAAALPMARTVDLTVQIQTRRGFPDLYPENRWLCLKLLIGVWRSDSLLTATRHQCHTAAWLHGAWWPCFSSARASFSWCSKSNLSEQVLLCTDFVAPIIFRPVLLFEGEKLEICEPASLFWMCAFGLIS